VDERGKRPDEHERAKGDIRRSDDDKTHTRTHQAEDQEDVPIRFAPDNVIVIAIVVPAIVGRR